MPSVRFLAPLLCLMAVLPASAHASPNADTIDVDHLIAAYHEAVVGHDGTRLASLFVPEGSAWFSVLSDAGLAQVRSTKPDAARLRPGSVQGFIKMVTTSKASLDPQHRNLKVRSDGAVASVTFDFSFFLDSKAQNIGMESWQLVKGDDGWRIASIVYSSTPPVAH